MATIRIKHVPEETHAVLRRRAAEAHQSLQEYLLAKLIEMSATRTFAEIADEIEREGAGGRFTIQDTLDALDEAREGR